MKRPASAVAKRPASQKLQKRTVQKNTQEFEAEGKDVLKRPAAVQKPSVVQKPQETAQSEEFLAFTPDRPTKPLIGDMPATPTREAQLLAPLGRVFEWDDLSAQDKLALLCTCAEASREQPEWVQREVVSTSSSVFVFRETE
jgi:hypothetical protein